MSAQIHEFDPLIYPRRLWVAVGVPYEAIKDMFEDVEPMQETANAQVDYTRRLKPDVKGGVLVRFPNRKTMTTEIISHEAAHIAIGIFDYIEASIDIRNQEPFAYLCGWIAKCMEEVKRQKNTKSTTNNDTKRVSAASHDNVHGQLQKRKLHDA